MSISPIRKWAGRLVGRLLWSSKPVSGNGAAVAQHAVEDMAGGVRPLGERYPNQPLLLVNVASQCGLTPQYEDLVRLDQRYRDRGLAVVGFPANDFGGQEPGTHDEIKAFCSTRYGVDFDVLAKIAVTGDAMHPLYRDLTSTDRNGAMGGPIKWNFTKFLVGRDGRVKARFEPGIEPGADAVIQAIETELGISS